MSIFISESYIGMHRPSCDALSIRLVAFTFIPTFYKLDKKIVSLHDVMVPSAEKSNLFIDGLNKDEIQSFKKKNMNNFVQIILTLHKEEGGDIYLGQDNDLAGNIMASLLYYKLIEAGVEKELILRIPLLSVGYDWGTFIGGTFYPEEQLIAIMEKRREERFMMNVSPRTQYGYKVLSALHLAEYLNGSNKPVFIPRKNMGTNTITYIVKYLIGEK